MFAGVESETNSSPENMPAGKTPDALGAGLLRKKDMPVNSASTPVIAPTLYEMKQPILGKILLSILVVAVLGGLGFAGWYGYDKFIKNKTAVPLSPAVDVSEEKKTEQVQPPSEITETKIKETETPPVQNLESSTSSDVTSNMNNDKILFGEAIDSDKDGLDDVREKELGTNQFNADSDTDGLNDGDEVIIWKTNPLNPDTDNDTYKDGEEVRNGYNPLGPGKLFNIPAGASTSTATTSATSKK
jgi:hypothetical protein